MNLNKSLLIYSVVFLFIEGLVLVGTFFISWQSVFYFYPRNSIYETVYGIYTTVYYFGSFTEPLPSLLAYWLYIRSADFPILWIIIPIYIILKPVLLFFRRFNLARLLIFTPLLFAMERTFALSTISTVQFLLFFLSKTFLYPQQGIGGITVLLVLFLGLYGINFFENAIMVPIIKKITKLFKEKPELELLKIAEESGLRIDQLYNNLSKVVYEGIILGVLTPEELIAFEEPKARELIVEAFRRVLRKSERVNINDLRKVMKNSRIWFPPRREEILNICKNAQEEGKLLAIIIDNEVVRQSEVGLAY